MPIRINWGRLLKGPYGKVSVEGNRKHCPGISGSRAVSHEARRNEDEERFWKPKGENVLSSRVLRRKQLPPIRNMARKVTLQRDRVINILPPSLPPLLPSLLVSYWVTLMANPNWKPEGKREPTDVVHIGEQCGQKGGWRKEENRVLG